MVRPSCWLSLAGNIASWKKKEGEKVGAGDEMAEIETDKVCSSKRRRRILHANGLPGFGWVLPLADDKSLICHLPTAGIMVWAVTPNKLSAQ